MLYELFCEECRCYFEITIEKEIDTRGLICVDCGQPEPRLIRTDGEVSTRINNLIAIVGDLQARVDAVENEAITESKNKKTVN